MRDRESGTALVQTTSIQLRLYPSREQARSFARFQGSLRQLWNALLAATNEAKEKNGRFLKRGQLQAAALEWNRLEPEPTRVEIGVQALEPKPINETRMSDALSGAENATPDPSPLLPRQFHASQFPALDMAETS